MYNSIYSSILNQIHKLKFLSKKSLLFVYKNCNFTLKSYFHFETKERERERLWGSKDLAITVEPQVSSCISNFNFDLNINFLFLGEMPFFLGKMIWLHVFIMLFIWQIVTIIEEIQQRLKNINEHLGIMLKYIYLVLFLFNDLKNITLWVSCVVVLTLIRINGLGNKYTILWSEYVFMILNCGRIESNFVLVDV